MSAWVQGGGGWEEWPGLPRTLDPECGGQLFWCQVLGPAGEARSPELPWVEVGAAAHAQKDEGEPWCGSAFERTIEKSISELQRTWVTLCILQWSSFVLLRLQITVGKENIRCVHVSPLPPPLWGLKGDAGGEVLFEAASSVSHFATCAQRAVWKGVNSWMRVFLLPDKVPGPGGAPLRLLFAPCVLFQWVRSRLILKTWFGELALRVS